MTLRSDDSLAGAHAQISLAEANPQMPTPAATLWQLFYEFLLIGAVSFGGGIVAYERILLIEKRKWLTADEFMATLAISQTMPGLNSVNLAVLAGNHVRGALGAVAASCGLLIPGMVFVLVAGMAYSAGEDHPLVNMLLAGVAAGATGLIAAITFKIGDQHFRHLKSLAIILATFVLMSFFKLSLIWVLVIMGPISLFIYRPRTAQNHSEKEPRL